MKKGDVVKIVLNGGYDAGEVAAEIASGPDEMGVVFLNVKGQPDAGVAFASSDFQLREDGCLSVEMYALKEADLDKLDKEGKAA